MALTTFPIQLRIPFTMPLIKSAPHRNALESSPVINPSAWLNPETMVL